MPSSMSFGAGQAFLQGEDGLVDHRHQDAVHHETRAVLDGDGCLADGGGEGLDRREGLVGGLQAADQLHQGHQRHRVEEVHADEARPGCSPTAASLVMEIDEVLVAITVVAGRCRRSP
jgi:hypothetical protein